jgi:hypothetical protein
MKKTMLAGAILTAALLTPLASANAQSFAVGANVGTPGIGVQAAFQASDVLVVRGTLDGLSFGRNETYSDVRYEGDAKLMTGGLFGDFHPGGGSLFVSGGAYFGKRKLELTARPTSSVEIGDQTFTPAQVGQLNGEAKLSKVQPFLGVGFDNTFTRESGWGFRAMAGVSFSKRPDVELNASGGTLSNDPNFLTRLAQEEAEARDDAEDFRYFPVVQVGVTRRF